MQSVGWFDLIMIPHTFAVIVMYPIQGIGFDQIPMPLCFFVDEKVRNF